MKSQKKKRGPEPTGKGTPVMVRLHEPMLSDIDKWGAEFAPEEKSRPAIIRRMLSEYLKHCGCGD